jgi:hypothetical protein
MRAAMILSISLAALGGCASGSSETLGSGIASYDALRQANTACIARGGQIKPRQGGDPAQLSDYSCVIPGAK